MVVYLIIAWGFKGLSRTMDCIFCRIASGAEPAAVVLDDGPFLAFLDGRPLFPGHCLLIPKTHVETLAELPTEYAAPLVRSTQLLCSAVEQGLKAEGAFVAINHRVSQSVPHLHVHVVPRRRKDGLRGFFWPRGKYRDDADRENVRAALAAAVCRLKSS
jgi:histidine triad (HIT) family protein